MKNILVLSGNPNRESFGACIARGYAEVAEKAGHKVDLVVIGDLSFDYDLLPGSELEPDLVKQQELITAADHIVIVTPVWWNNMPASLKAYFDRVLTSGFAFQYPHPNKLLNNFFGQRLLKGKSARVIVTQDSFRFVSLMLGNPFGWSLRWAVFWFVGITNVRFCYFPRVLYSSQRRRERFLKRIEKIAAKGK